MDIGKPILKEKNTVVPFQKKAKKLGSGHPTATLKLAYRK